MPEPDPLRVHAERHGDRPAVIVDGPGGGSPAVTTFAELDRAVNRLAHAFRALGLAPGERLVWCGPNSPEVVQTVHAARKARQVAVPLSYRFTADEMRFVIDDSEAALVVVDAEQASLVAGVRDRLPRLRHVLVFGGEVPEGCEAWEDVVDGQPFHEPGAPSAVGAQMIYTSGTTGRPKGAVRTRSDAGIVAALLAELGLRPAEEVHLTTGPLYHSGPLAFLSLNHTLGCPVVLLRRFDARTWLRLVGEHRVTNTFTAPTQLKRIVALPPEELAAADLSSMRCLVANAAPVPYALKREVIARLGDGFLYEIYGSTELGVATVLTPADQLRKPGSCGRPYGGIGVRIVADDGTEAPVGTPGELFLRTGLAMDGYHGAVDGLPEHDDGTWRSVGDVAYVDDEGYVYICDRKKDMIITGGMNVYPAEVEAVLHEHPGVLDVAVIGVPDDEWGERVHAVVQARPGAELDLGELRAFVDGRMAGYKRPRSYEQRDTLPRTDAGKLLKRVLREEHWRDRDVRV